MSRNSVFEKSVKTAVIHENDVKSK